MKIIFHVISLILVIVFCGQAISETVQDVRSRESIEAARMQAVNERLRLNEEMTQRSIGMHPDQIAQRRALGEYAQAKQDSRWRNAIEFAVYILSTEVGSDGTIPIKDTAILAGVTQSFSLIEKYTDVETGTTVFQDKKVNAQWVSQGEGKPEKISLFTVGADGKRTDIKMTNGIGVTYDEIVQLANLDDAYALQINQQKAHDIREKEKSNSQSVIDLNQVGTIGNSSNFNPEGLSEDEWVAQQMAAIHKTKQEVPQVEQKAEYGPVGDLSEEEWIAEQLANEKKAGYISKRSGQEESTRKFFNKASGRVFIDLVAQHLGGALIVFPMVWLVMRKKGGQKYNVSYSWLITGLLVTGFGAGVVRYASIFIVGGQVTINPENGGAAFFGIGLPLIFAISMCLFLRTKTIHLLSDDNGDKNIKSRGMLGSLKISFKFASMSGKWMRVTRVDPGDKGQVARKAMDYINSLGLEPEDAWLVSLTNWMLEMPWQDSQAMLARAMIKFLDECEGKIALSVDNVIWAREEASKINLR